MIKNLILMGDPLFLYLVEIFLAKKHPLLSAHGRKPGDGFENCAKDISQSPASQGGKAIPVRSYR
jgi:hypothetical protein